MLLSILLYLLYSTIVGAGYAPRLSSCPSHNLTRKADGLSESEAQWLKGRHAKTTPNLKIFLETKTNLTKSEIEKAFAANDDINIGLAFSGGGFRAMFAGAGQLAALDNRTDGAFDHGLGGLLQSTSYVSGLSGGNWLIGSLAANNWISVQDILNHDELWDLDHTLLLPKGLSLSTIKFYHNIDEDVDSKRNAGFDTSMTDIWARALSRRFFTKSTDYGDSITWSSMRNMSSFSGFEMPFPISVADGKYSNETSVNLNATNFEFNPFEMGSWDPTVKAFIDTQYLGSAMEYGLPTSNSCVIEFDNAGFVMGTSSTLFNAIVSKLTAAKMNLAASIHKVLMRLMSHITVKEDTISIIDNNPFYRSIYHANNDTSITSSKKLYLVDGGEDSQNIPFTPLIQPARKMDVIMAFDNSNDISGFPAGFSMSKTFDRNMNGLGKQRLFPYVPDANTFVSRNYTTRPTFFGCDAKNLTSLGPHTPPLIVYVANRPYHIWSNFSTEKLSYTNAEMHGAVTNGFEVATRRNLTQDSEWSTCVGCAVIRRSQERQGIEQSDVCKKCFDNYCWKGEVYELPLPGANSNYMGNLPYSPHAVQPKEKGGFKKAVKNIWHKVWNKILPEGLGAGP